MKLSQLLESAVDTALKNKSEKSGIPMRKLRAIYNRGLAAWRSSHCPGTTANQWAMARVNSVIAGGPARKSDADLLEAKKPDRGPASWLEGVMLEFIRYGLHVEYVRQGQLKTVWSITDFTTGKLVGHIYMKKSLLGYHFQVNAAEADGSDGEVVWRGVAQVQGQAKTPEAKKANADLIFKYLLRALESSKPRLPIA